ncbi:MAG: hypothetical protein V3V08_23730 [Nannocystaceae bacterium]
MRILTVVLVTATALTSIGCSYGAITSHNGKLYVARNDLLVGGALRKIYECTPDGAGNMSCVAVSGAP